MTSQTLTEQKPIETTSSGGRPGLWGMTAAERVQAMWDRRLSFEQLREWTSLRPQEVPLIGGEFAWIAIRTPEWAEA